MSHCAIITFKGDTPEGIIEYRNSWGGSARIWSALFDAHLKRSHVPYDTWLGDQSSRLWDLAKDTKLPLFLRAVHAATFDKAYVKLENFAKYAQHLREFDGVYPAKADCVNHLPKWADFAETCEADAIGFHGTSVSENLWSRWDEEKEESVDVSLSEGFEVYDWLASLETT